LKLFKVARILWKIRYLLDMEDGQVGVLGGR
jgi:hypothetical protein